MNRAEGIREDLVGAEAINLENPVHVLRLLRRASADLRQADARVESAEQRALGAEQRLERMAEHSATTIAEIQRRMSVEEARFNEQRRKLQVRSDRTEHELAEARAAIGALQARAVAGEVRARSEQDRAEAAEKLLAALRELLEATRPETEEPKLAAASPGLEEVQPSAPDLPDAFESRQEEAPKPERAMDDLVEAVPTRRAPGGLMSVAATAIGYGRSRRIKLASRTG